MSFRRRARAADPRRMMESAGRDSGTGTSGTSTSTDGYTERLLQRSNVWWKRALDVQRPYRWNLRRLEPGLTLDVGCGIGRNLSAVDGVGVDHNAASVAHCRSLGLRAYLPEDFLAAPEHAPGTFDSLLLAHVTEHMTRREAGECIRMYLPYLKDTAKIILITPQERGYRSDPTHVEFMDFAASAAVLRDVGFEADRSFSFPFPRALGRAFTYNEFVVVGRRSR